MTDVVRAELESYRRSSRSVITTLFCPIFDRTLENGYIFALLCNSNFIQEFSHLNVKFYYSCRLSLSYLRVDVSRCQLLTTLIKESVRSVKSFMTTERTNSKINNVTLLCNLQRK